MSKKGEMPLGYVIVYTIMELQLEQCVFLEETVYVNSFKYQA